MGIRSHSRWLRLLTIFFLLCFLYPNPVSAAGITVTDNTALQMRLINEITFKVTVESEANIDNVTLIYGVTSDSCMSSQVRKEVTVKPGKSVIAMWIWNRESGGNLPPGVEYWWQWEIHAEDGETLTTEVKRQTVEDENYQWQKLQKDQITLYWAEGGFDFGRTMLNLATSSLERLATNAGLKPEDDIRMMIYPSAEAMKLALAFSSEWAGGVAFPEYNISLIGIAPDQTDWAEEVIPHELAHLVTDMRVFNCQGNDLPHWFHEGLSDYAEGPLPQAEIDVMRTELKNNNLPPLTSLANGFPADSQRANLAYSQSRNVVTFITETYGTEKLSDLFDRVRAGEPIEPALQGVYGLDTAGLDQAWRASLGFGDAPEPIFATPTAAAGATAIPTFSLFSPFGTDTPTPLPPTLTPAPTETPVTVAAAATAMPTATAVSGEQSPKQHPSGSRLLLGAGIGGGLLLILGVGSILLQRKQNH